MLAAANPSVEEHFAASVLSRRGMDCKQSNNANKKLVQARLPFKRLNPELKDQNQSPKRRCAHAVPEPTDMENESSPNSVQNRPPLVNGRGPLDGFLSRRSPEPSNEDMVIDLTEDSTSSPKKCISAPTPASSSSATEGKVQGAETSSSSETSSKPDETCTNTSDYKTVNVDEEETVEEHDVSQLDTTQDSDSESEEHNESGNISSLGNKSMLSASTVSSTSESSPERSKTDDPVPTTPTEPKTTPTTADERKAKRRSIKTLQVQDERLRMRQEKERLREEAKAAKNKKKEEARKLKEEKEKEKREKKEKEEREKREKKEKEDKEKADRLKAKEEQRKVKLEAKLEEKRKKEEEKRVKEEEKRLKEEKDRLKAEKAEITRFLQKPKIQQAPKTLAAACGKFAPFEIKENMALAPLCRVQCADSVLEELDQCLVNQNRAQNGLREWIGRQPRQSGPTNPRQKRELLSDCVAVEVPKPEGVPDRKRYGAMKLLQFHGNYRPAYWGTWSKKSSRISPRFPLRLDKDLLDYEVDSDEEWEEEEPGESLSHSEGEDEEEAGEDDDEDDDGFFVPHGYLSDDEGALDEEEGGDLEKQKLRQKLKAREWDELMSTKKKMKVLEPVVRGCMWEGEGTTSEVFQPYSVCLIEPLPKMDNSLSPDELSRKCQKEAELLGQLLPLLHGNINSSKVIINEFQEFCRRQASSSSSTTPPPPELSSPQSPVEKIPSRLQLKRLIKNNAIYEKRSTYRRCCWYVHTEVLSRFSQDGLPLPCQWTYLTTGAKEEEQAATGSQGNSPTTPQNSSTSSSASNKRKSTGSMSITKFMKRCTDTEQTEAMETDGFQADTEDDDEECVIISAKSGPAKENASTKGDVPMEVLPSDTAALPVASVASTIATA